MNPFQRLSTSSFSGTKATRPLLILFLFGLSISAAFSNRAEALTLELYGAVDSKFFTIPDNLEYYYYQDLAEMDIGDFVRIHLELFPSKQQFLDIGAGSGVLETLNLTPADWEGRVSDIIVFKEATFFNSLGVELAKQDSIFDNVRMTGNIFTVDTLSGPAAYDFSFELDLEELTGMASAWVASTEAHENGAYGELTTKIFGGRYLDEGAQGWAGAAASVPDSGSSIALLSLSLLGVVLVRRRVRRA